MIPHLWYLPSHARGLELDKLVRMHNCETWLLLSRALNLDMKAKLCNAKELYLTNIYVDIHFQKHCNSKKKIPEAYTPFLFSFKSVCLRWENKRHIYFMYIFNFFKLTITGKTGLKKYIFSKILSLDHMLPYIKIERVYLLQYQKFIHEIVFLEFSFF